MLLESPHASSATQWALFLGLIVASIVAALLFERVVIRALVRATSRTRTDLDDFLVKTLHPSLTFVLLVAAIWLGVKVGGVQVPGPVGRWTRPLAAGIVILWVSIAATRSTQALLRWRTEKHPRFEYASTILGRLVNAVIYVVAGLMILRYYGIEITPLLTTLGIAGVAVALALQDTLSNFFGGVWIQAGGSLRPGHHIRMEIEKVEGYLVQVGWRTARIRTGQGNIVVVPNARLAQAIVTNFNLPDPKVTIALPWRIGADQDLDHVERVLADEAESATHDVAAILPEPKPVVRILPGVADHGFTAIVAVQCRSFPEQGLVEHELTKRIHARLRREGIPIPFPARLSLSPNGHGGRAKPAGPAAESIADSASR